jgi:hypothetical protein
LLQEFLIWHGTRIAGPLDMSVLAVADYRPADPIEFRTRAYVDEAGAWIELKELECLGRRQRAGVGQLVVEAALLGLGIQLFERTHDSKSPSDQKMILARRVLHGCCTGHGAEQANQQVECPKRVQNTSNAPKLGFRPMRISGLPYDGADVSGKRVRSRLSGCGDSPQMRVAVGLCAGLAHTWHRRCLCGADRFGHRLSAPAAILQKCEVDVPGRVS